MHKKLLRASFDIITEERIDEEQGKASSASERVKERISCTNFKPPGSGKKN